MPWYIEIRKKFSLLIYFKVVIIIIIIVIIIIIIKLWVAVMFTARDIPEFTFQIRRKCCSTVALNISQRRKEPSIQTSLESPFTWRPKPLCYVTTNIDLKPLYHRMVECKNKQTSWNFLLENNPVRNRWETVLLFAIDKVYFQLQQNVDTINHCSTIGVIEIMSYVSREQILCSKDVLFSFGSQTICIFPQSSR